MTRLLIESDMNLEVRGPDGMTPLLYAVRNDNLIACDMLLEQGCNVNARDDLGSTVFHYFAGDGNILLLEQMLEHEPDLNVRDNKGNTPLLISAGRGYVRMVEALLAAGARDVYTDSNGDNALLLLVNIAEPALVCKLLESGADIQQRGLLGKGVLARIFQNPLIGEGYSSELRLNMRSAYSWTDQNSSREKEVIEILLDKNVDINAVDSFGYTPLMEAVAADSDIDLISLLLQNGADTDLISDTGCTALFLAEEMRRKDVERLLVSTGAIEADDYVPVTKTPVTIESEYIETVNESHLIDSYWFRFSWFATRLKERLPFTISMQILVSVPKDKRNLESLQKIQPDLQAEIEDVFSTLTLDQIKDEQWLKKLVISRINRFIGHNMILDVALGRFNCIGPSLSK